MENFEKYVYNTWLKHSRKGQPWQPRKDFSDFENDKNYVPLMKLVSFFRSHPTVNVEWFIQAPYLVHPEESFYLDFYITFRAITAYSVMTSTIANEQPDKLLSHIVDSFQFIRDFCTEKGITIEEYLSYKAGVINDFVTHLLQHKTNIYGLFAFPNYDSQIKDFSKEELEFILGSKFVNQLDMFRTRWQTSSKAKKLSVECYKKIKKILEKEKEETKI